MKENLEDLFKPYLENPNFKEVLDLVKQNSSGKIWIIGGYLYKNLAAALYGSPLYEYDFDFIVEHKNETLKPAVGWNIELNTYKNQNYVRASRKMSFTDIHKTIRSSGFKPLTIENFIIDTPLNIQSLAYDIAENKIIGDIGIQALREKVIQINNRAQADHYLKLKGKTLEEYVDEKASDLMEFRIEI